MRNKAPALYYGNVPEAQHLALQLVGHALDNMEYYTSCFEAAIKLFDYSERHRRKKSGVSSFRDWQFIAARDGAFSIYHFSEAMKSLSQALHECDYVKRRLDCTIIRASRKEFERKFPNCKRMRDSTGHAAEKTSTTRQHLHHGFSGTIRRRGLNLTNVNAFVAIDHLHGRTYSNTWHGKFESYSLSRGTLKNLIGIRNQIYAAFEDMNAKYKGS